jgi:hypothetical protein
VNLEQPTIWGPEIEHFFLLSDAEEQGQYHAEWFSPLTGAVFPS